MTNAPAQTVDIPVVLSDTLTPDELRDYMRQHYPHIAEFLLQHVTGNLLLSIHSEGMDILEAFEEGSITGANKADLLALKVLISSIIRSSLATNKSVAPKKNKCAPRSEAPNPEIQKRSWAEIVASSKASSEQKDARAAVPTAEEISKRNFLEENGAEVSIVTPNPV